MGARPGETDARVSPRSRSLPPRALGKGETHHGRPGARASNLPSSPSSPSLFLFLADAMRSLAAVCAQSVRSYRTETYARRSEVATLVASVFGAEHCNVTLVTLFSIAQQPLVVGGTSLVELLASRIAISHRNVWLLGSQM